jgi:anthranilate 1,2-dioxygenase small subunit
VISIQTESVSGPRYDAVVALEYAYGRCIADGQLEQWPEFFVEDGVYQVLPRENDALGMPLHLMMCDSKGMLEDRVRSLREANIYNIHYPLHQISNIEIVGSEGDVLDVRANYSVFQTDQEGRTVVYSVGRYRDKVVFPNGEPRFKEKTVVLDTFNVPNLLAVPL